MSEQARILSLVVALFQNADGDPALTLQQLPNDDELNDVWECREREDYLWTLARAFGPATAPAFLGIPADTEDWQDVLDFLEEHHDEVAGGPFACTIAAAAGVISIFDSDGRRIYEQ